MPLDPKQLPPYYTIGTMPTPTSLATFLRLNTQYTDEVTTGTTETDLYLYTLPANTLTQNGDTLKIYYAAIQTTGTQDHIHRFYFKTVNQFTHDDQGTDPPIIELTLIRTSTTTARLASKITVGPSVYTYEQTINTIDWTIPIATKFTGQCSGAATIQTYLMTIDKIKSE